MELLVTCAMIVLLAALALPALAQVRAQARRATCLSRVSQIARAHSLYLQDWDEQLSDWWRGGPLRPEPYRARVYWTEYLRPYLRSEAVLHDASASKSEPRPRGFLLADYALLTWGPGGSGAPGDAYWRWAGPPLTLAAVRRPAETVTLTDGSTTTELARGCVARHGGGMVAGFLDGHARWLSRDQAYTVLYDPRGPYQANFYYHYGAADR